jgi:hypothetical protein
MNTYWNELSPEEKDRSLFLEAEDCDDVMELAIRGQRTQRSRDGTLSPS